MEVIEKIKQRRKELKITQKEMAEALGISQAAYAKIEKGNVSGGTKSISIKNGKCIAETLKVSFNELFEIEGGTGSAELTELIKENNELKKQISKLQEEQLMDKKQLIDALKTHNLLERFALGLWGNTEEVEQVKKKSREIENRAESYKFQIESRPFNVNDTESMMKYISENFIWTPKK